MSKFNRELFFLNIRTNELEAGLSTNFSLDLPLIFFIQFLSHIKYYMVITRDVNFSRFA